MIEHTLRDDFATFLDRSYYVDAQDKLNNPQSGHTVYHPNLFNHKDPRQEGDYAYYKRCVERFQCLLQKPEHKLFVMVLPNRSAAMEEACKQEILHLNQTLGEYTTNYTLLVIYHLPHSNATRHQKTQEGNVHFLEIHTKSLSNGVHFVNTAEDAYLDRVLRATYSFQLLPL